MNRTTFASAPQFRDALATIPQMHSQNCLRAERVVSLTPELKQLWREWRQANATLHNGCFHDAFFAAVSRVRDDVEYAVLMSHDDSPIGILPYQRIGSRVAQPAGGRLNDLHGVISSRPLSANLAQLLRSLGIGRFDFHGLVNDFAPVAGTAKAKTTYRTLVAPEIDLSMGAEAYHDWLMQHSSTVKRQGQKTRALSRKFGEIRVEVDCRDPAVLEQVMTWKRARWQRSRTFDILSLDWTSNLVREIFATREPDFRGLLTVLWVGKRPVAGHIGFESDGILHYWMPAHDHDFRRFSPGTLLMSELVLRDAYEAGIHRIDLGHGESPLKERFANSAIQVECGCYGKSLVERKLNQRLYELREAFRYTPGKEWIKRYGRPLLPDFGSSEFR